MRFTKNHATVELAKFLYRCSTHIVLPSFVKEFQEFKCSIKQKAALSMNHSQWGQEFLNLSKKLDGTVKQNA